MLLNLTWLIPGIPLIASFFIALLLLSFSKTMNRLTKPVSYFIIISLTFSEIFNFILFKESCTKNKNNDCYDGLDRLGLCCFILDEHGTRVFKSRYSDFPWMDNKLYKS